VKGGGRNQPSSSPPTVPARSRLGSSTGIRFLRSQSRGLRWRNPQLADFRAWRHLLQRGVDLRIEKPRAADGAADLGQQKLLFAEVQAVSNIGDQQRHFLRGAN